MQDVQVNIDAFSSNLHEAVEKKEVRKRFVLFSLFSFSIGT